MGMCCHCSTQRTNTLDGLSTFICHSYSDSFNRHRFQLHTASRKILMKLVTTYPSKKTNSYLIFTQHPPPQYVELMRVHLGFGQKIADSSQPKVALASILLPVLRSQDIEGDAAVTVFLDRASLKHIFLLRSVRRQRQRKAMIKENSEPLEAL